MRRFPKEQTEGTDYSKRNKKRKEIGSTAGRDNDESGVSHNSFPISSDERVPSPDRGRVRVGADRLKPSILDGKVVLSPPPLTGGEIISSEKVVPRTLLKAFILFIKLLNCCNQFGGKTSITTSFVIN